MLEFDLNPFRTYIVLVNISWSVMNQNYPNSNVNGNGHGNGNKVLGI